MPAMRITEPGGHSLYVGRLQWSRHHLRELQLAGDATADLGVSPSDDLRVTVEDLSQVGWWFHPVLFHHLEQTQDVPHPRQRHALFAR